MPSSLANGKKSPRYELAGRLRPLVHLGQFDNYEKKIPATPKVQ